MNILKRYAYYALAVLTFACVTALPSNASAASTIAQTKYPIVMVHGAFGFDNILGIIDYWYGITDKLRANGAKVYVTTLSEAALHEVRGEELIPQIQQIMAITGATKVNIIAHSQGGTAARYVAALHPDWIASISCAHCGNEGTPFAEGFTAFLNVGNGLVGDALDPIVSGLLDLLGWLSIGPADGSFNNSNTLQRNKMKDLAKAFTYAEYDRFNALYPQAMPYKDCSKLPNYGAKGLATGGGPELVNGVRYFSWGGHTPYTVAIDPLDIIAVNATYLFTPWDTKWDGLLPSCGMALGTFLNGDYKTNHYDAINQAFGLVAAYVDIPSIYVSQASRLKAKGL